MEFKEILSRLSIPVRPKVNEEEVIKAEESNMSEVLINFTDKNTNFVPLGFESKEEEENEEGDYSDYSVDDYMEDVPA